MAVFDLNQRANASAGGKTRGSCSGLRTRCAAPVIVRAGQAQRQIGVSENETRCTGRHLGSGWVHPDPTSPCRCMRRRGLSGRMHWTPRSCGCSQAILRWVLPWWCGCSQLPWWCGCCSRATRCGYSRATRWRRGGSQVILEIAQSRRDCGPWPVQSDPAGWLFGLADWVQVPGARPSSRERVPSVARSETFTLRDAHP
jgi:hypothetical protein